MVKAKGGKGKTVRALALLRRVRGKSTIRRQRSTKKERQCLKARMAELYRKWTDACAAQRRRRAEEWGGRLKMKRERKKRRRIQCRGRESMRLSQWGSRPEVRSVWWRRVHVDEDRRGGSGYGREIGIEWRTKNWNRVTDEKVELSCRHKIETQLQTENCNLVADRKLKSSCWLKIGLQFFTIQWN